MMSTQIPLIDTLGKHPRLRRRCRASGLSRRVLIRHIGGALLIAMVALGVLAPHPAAAQASVRDLYVVAHQDDDLLFMNPNIQMPIAAGRTVKTVYLTAGDACRGRDFWELQREAGVMAAYARMAGVNNSWTLTDNSIREIKLVGRPKVSLLFFRLPATATEDGVTCAHGESLKKLWLGDIQTISALDGTNTYTKQGLIDTLAALISEFHPDRINIMDSSGQTPCGTGDPSNCIIFYPNVGQSYFYDHTDHYHSALFALAARVSYLRQHEFRRYRGYSSALESENVAGSDFTLKQDVFEVYAEHDDTIGDDPPFGPFYDAWIRRQYLVQYVLMADKGGRSGFCWLGEPIEVELADGVRATALGHA